MEQATTIADGDPSVVRLPTDKWDAPRQQAPAWQLYGTTIWPFEFEPTSNPLRYEVKLRSMPGLGIGHSISSVSRVRRTARHIVNDDLVLRMNLAGSRTLCQRGREAIVGPGEAVLSSGAEISTATTTESRFVSFRVPVKPIKALVPDVEDRVARTIPSGTDGLRLLAAYGDILQDPATTATSELRRIAVTHVHDLVALTLGAVGEASELARTRGGRAARLREIKSGIEQQLGDPDLSIGKLAASHRMPVRYLQRLFEADGATFTDFVLERRLRRARQLLGDPRYTHQPIGYIAFETGFANQSYFNRTFRARFGASPSDVRAQARRER